VTADNEEVRRKKEDTAMKRAIKFAFGMPKTEQANRK
jgi:hypothetical protein